MIKKIKGVIEDAKYWWNDESLIEHTNGEEIVGAFFEGSGQSCWCYIIIIGLYLLITKQKFVLAKR